LIIFIKRGEKNEAELLQREIFIWKKGGKKIFYLCRKGTHTSEVEVHLDMPCGAGEPCREEKLQPLT